MKESDKKVIQKTLRFYDDSPDDMKALHALHQYREYGFLNSREMVICAINQYVSDRNENESIIDSVELIAEAVVNRIREENISVDISAVEKLEGEYNENKNSRFAEAMQFINSL